MPDQLPSVAEARALILAAAAPLAPEDVAVDAGLGRVLAEEIRAAGDVPADRTSAMDGFAVRSGKGDRRVALVGESRAGAPATVTVGWGEAVRISTGAVVPEGADAVVQLELVEEQGDHAVLQAEVAPGRNIREPGEDMRAGDAVLGAGRTLGPPELAVAVAAGRAAVRCARRPRVAVLATGDELVPAGAPLGPGQVHDSNLLMLRALVTRDGGDVALARHVPDHAGFTRRAIAEALEGADMVVLSGGISVGAHDHVKAALAELGVEQRFERVAMRPGKPTWFGVKERTLVLGLPGNPVPALIGFVLFARPALAALQWAEPPAGRLVTLAETLAPSPLRDECRRMRLEDGRAYASGPQGARSLTSLAQADGIVVVPRGDLALVAGSVVELIAL